MDPRTQHYSRGGHACNNCNSVVVAHHTRGKSDNKHALVIFLRPLIMCIHTHSQGNDQLSKDLAARFKQTLLLKFHHAFQIELQRIVLLGGKTLVALWRCVGERVNEDGTFIYDRHGENVDPFVRLRVEIVRCFTADSETELRGQPLTYSDSKHNLLNSPSKETATLLAENGTKKPVLKRQNTIEEKTPGVGQGDGFIHTTLCRLPLECLSQKDVSLDKVHRLCREASEFFSGHRMVVSKFRFIETVGRGGEVRRTVVIVGSE